MRKRHQLLGQILIDLGYLSPSQLEEALERQCLTHELLGEILMELGYLSPDRLAQAQAHQMGVPYEPLPSASPQPEAYRLLPAHVARQLRVLPLRRVGRRRLVVAMMNPLDLVALEELQRLTGYRIQPAYTEPSQLLQAIELYYPLPVQKGVERFAQAGHAREGAISSNAYLGNNVQLGHYVVIEEGAVIEDNVRIGHHVVIRQDTRIGEGTTIADHTVLGKLPARAPTSAVTEEKPLPPLQIGRGVTIGAQCVLYRGAVIGNFSFVGDLASVREEVEVGEKTIIGRGVTVENKSRIGSHVKIETEAYITAFSTVEDDCFIAPEVTFTNDKWMGRGRDNNFRGPIIRRGARLGANATILPGIEVGEEALVAAGAVVTRDVPPRKVYAGVPARECGEVPVEQLLETR